MNITLAQIKRFSKMKPTELLAALQELSPTQISTVVHKCKEVIKESPVDDPAQEGVWAVMDEASWMEVREKLKGSII